VISEAAARADAHHWRMQVAEVGLLQAVPERRDSSKTLVLMDGDSPPQALVGRDVPLAARRRIHHGPILAGLAILAAVLSADCIRAVQPQWERLSRHSPLAPMGSRLMSLAGDGRPRDWSMGWVS
jgi:hypothetical protein